MTHTLVFQDETVTDAVFVCSTCGKVIGFNKEGIGEPHAVLVAGVWVQPENEVDEYIGECT